MYNSIRTLCALACFVGWGGDAQAAFTWQADAEGDSGSHFQDLPPIGYATAAQMTSELQALAGKSSLLSLQTIGQSPAGQPLVMATLSSDSAAEGPEVLVVANLEGDRLVASEVAMGLIRHLSTGDSPLLGVAKVHVLAVANPDGAKHALEGGFAWRGAAVDEDRDGRLDEDGPTDLNGDGKVLWLRVPSTSGAWHASKTDARCSVKAKDVREQAGAFHLRREGYDTDGDRSFSEDGPGGIAVDANFAHRWEQYASEAGPYPLSEPESRALADFLIAHPRVACVLVLDDEDNLAKPAKGNDKVTTDSTEPMKDDAGLVAFLGKRLKPESAQEEEAGAEDKGKGGTDDVGEESGASATVQLSEVVPVQAEDVEVEEIVAAVDEAEASESEESSDENKWVAPRGTDHGRGNFADWAYFQRGVLVLESAVWSPSLKIKGAEGKALPKEATDEEKLLAWGDRTYGAGYFQEWTPFEHKTLGAVEIGGFLPLVQINPPATALPELIERYAAFVDSLAEDFARIEWSEVAYTPLDGQGLFEIRAKLVNRGRLSSITAMGQKTRVSVPIRVSLQLPDGAQLLVGRAQSSVRRLTGFGDAREFHWIVQVPDGAGSPHLFARSNTAGQARLTLEVK